MDRSKKNLVNKIKIGVNIRIYEQQPSGIQNFIYGLFSELIRNYHQYQFIFFSKGIKKLENTALYYSPHRLVSKIFKKIHPHLVNIFFDNIYILALIYPLKLNIFIAPSYILPILKPKKTKYITVIHDLSYLTYKHNPFNLYMNYVMYMKLSMPFVLQRADAIVAPSRYVKNEIMNKYKISDKKINVIYEGKDEFFYQEKDEKKFEKIKKKYSIFDEYCFTTATNHERKNIFGLVEAFKKIKNSQIQLIITGLLPKETIRQLHDHIAKLKLKEKVRFLGFVTKEELRILYSYAKIFIFPSFEEGFGLPILESASCGCLPIGSNTGSLPEVIGNKQLLFDPRNIESITGKINDVLSFDQFEYDKKVETIKKHIKNFTWENTAREYDNLFIQLMKKNL